MTREQILARLEQEYARRREDNLRLFEQRREEACGRCPGLRELLEKRISSQLEKIMEDRGVYEADGEFVAVTEGSDKYAVYLAAPILSQGDMMGAVLLITDKPDKRADAIERALAETASAFLGRHMED